MGSGAGADGTPSHPSLTVAALAICLELLALGAQAAVRVALTHTLELTSMVYTIAKVPGFKERQDRMSQGGLCQARSLAPLHKYKRPLLTLTAPPIGQQVVALSAVAPWPSEGANTLMLAAVVPKAAVVNGWWEGKEREQGVASDWSHQGPQSRMQVVGLAYPCSFSGPAGVQSQLGSDKNRSLES